jgi:hypothetical protein
MLTFDQIQSRRIALGLGEELPVISREYLDNAPIFNEGGIIFMEYLKGAKALSIEALAAIESRRRSYVN